MPVTILGLGFLEWLRLPDVDALLRGVESSTVLLDREGRALRIELTSSELLALWVPLDGIDPQIVEATICVEDQRFRSHLGVDPLAVLRAMWCNITNRRIVSGASTLTMQVARLLRPLPRGYYGKFREMVLALEIERRVSKDRILELYLNLSPHGGNLRGVGAAARRYFGREPDDLSLSEAALISGLPQSPSRLRPDRHPERARRRRDWVLDRMLALERIGPDEHRIARSNGVHCDVRPLPFRAPHFSEWALRLCSRGEEIRSSLDPGIQRLAEETVRRRLSELADLGVRNGSMVIVETDSGKIRALVGSQDYFDPESGQVNGAASLRSPGSLLKPFIYGLAFERRLVTPDTILDDRPRHFRDGYDPRNFTGRFLGSVTAREALRRSLNVPAVDLLARLGVDTTIDSLRRFGMRNIRHRADHYGLALGLGGVELTLLELVEAYATLARDGLHRPLSFRDDAPVAPVSRAMARAAVRQITEILESASWSEVERLGPLDLPRVALKTGTSFGFRDAWALAYTGGWTVGLWLGNFDSEASGALVGRSAAVPAVLDLVRQLPDLGRPPGGFRVAAPAEVSHAASSILRTGSLVDARVGEPKRIRWIAPGDRTTVVRHERRGGDVLRLLAEAEPQAARVFSWFVDGRFVGRTPSGEGLDIPLIRGAHRITLVSDSGYSESRSIRVD